LSVDPAWPLGSEPAPAPERRFRRRTLALVFATILIDFVGFSVLIPVLPLFGTRLGATPVQVSLFLSLYALAQLLFLPVWGWISDRTGRRPVILVSLFGTAGAFVLLALARDIPTIYLSRILSGFFAASIGTAQAVVTDVTPPGRRAEGMGLIGAALGVGMILGPVLGGALASLHEKAPFWAVAGLAALNGLLAMIWLPESRPPRLHRPPWRDLLGALVPTPLRLVMWVHDRRIALFLVLFFVVFSAFSVLESMITLYLGARFGADELDAALVFAWIGIFLVLTQGAGMRVLVPRVGEENLVRIGLAAMALGIAAVALVPALGWLYLVGPVIAVGNGLAFPAFTSLYTKACRADQAGELLGQSQSMATTGRIIGPYAAGVLMEARLGAPFVVSGAVMALALLLFWLLRRSLLAGLEAAPD